RQRGSHAWGHFRSRPHLLCQWISPASAANGRTKRCTGPRRQVAFSGCHVSPAAAAGGRSRSAAWRIMNGITATELQLLACFGVEPHLLEARVPWCYNEAAYVLVLDDLSVSFAVQPSSRDLRLISCRGKRRLYGLHAVGVPTFASLMSREWMR